MTLIPYYNGDTKRAGRPPFVDRVLPYSAGHRVLHLFRMGLDTVAIAARMGCTPAAAANALARARDEERRSVA